MSHRALICLVLLLAITHHTSSFELCTNITGVWRNSLGSRAILSQHSHGRIKGSYVTAVEIRSDSSDVTGVLKQLSGSIHGTLVTFHVNWIESMTTWIGQCHVVGGIERLTTQWILKESVDECNDNWMSYRIGQDTFERLIESDEMNERND